MGIVDADRSLRVAIGDDDVLLREGIAPILTDADEVRVQPPRVAELRAAEGDRLRALADERAALLRVAELAGAGRATGGHLRRGGDGGLPPAARTGDDADPLRRRP
jgi:hypothetical protein